jgi:hypothetical protein
LSLSVPEHQGGPGKALVVLPCLLTYKLSHYYYFQPFTNYFPQANINELLSPDLLHQLIKGAFKDHLVNWMNHYVKTEHLE